MSRRSHKKSKTGCVACKRRHVKCDENRPACVNCTTAQLECSLLQTDSVSTEVAVPTTLPWMPQATPTVPLNPFQINVVHVDLLCHLWTDIWKDLEPTPLTVDESIGTFQKYASSAPYLSHQALAFSALHLSKLRPDRAEFYHHYADGLQHEALQSFNRQSAEVNDETCVPMLLFSWLLGLHMLCDTIMNRTEDLGIFLDSFVRYMRLHQGVKLMTAGRWDFLRASELREVLRPFPNPVRTNRGNECNKLLSMIDQIDASVAVKAVYQSVVELLQPLFDVHREKPRENVFTVFVWPIVVPAEFTDLLAQRRPEALVVLAYYAVLLHRHRQLWVVGDGGKFLIRSITKILGSEWTSHLAWPNLELLTA